MKYLLNNVIPTETDFYNNEYAFNYMKRVSESIEEIDWRIEKMLKDFQINDEILKSFKKYSKQLEKFINSNKFYDIVKQGQFKTLEFIHTFITDMREEFVTSVNKGFIGYYTKYGLDVIEPQTINEYLHYVHSYIINNNRLYSSLPIINTTVKENDWRGISLRGIQDELGTEIYTKILESNIDSDCIDIVNLKNKTLLMARDLGHASVIEIDKSNPEKYFVEYFIPKNTSLEKSGKLKGINVNKEAFATGSFESNDLANDLCILMKGIPTDMDIKWNFDIKPGHSL